MRPLKKDTRLVKSLHQKKFRNEYGLFLVEGRKMVEEALLSGFVIEALYTTDDEWAARHKEALRIPQAEMEQMSALATSSGYLAVLGQKENEPALSLSGHVVVLDGISDPGNFGTILRSAEWFGVQSVCCTPDCVELYNPKTVQSTMGSLFRVNVNYYETDVLVKMLRSKGYSLVGADMEGEQAFSFNYPAKTALVIGSESHGIRPAMKELLDVTVTIPGTGKAESLNASVAASILLAELFQRS